ncbi:Tubulin gamma chain, partial [Aduncisulcus paluster]
VMAATTTTLRYPGYMNNDLVGLMASLIPTPKCHFLMTSYAPITSATTAPVSAVHATTAADATKSTIKKTSVPTIMTSLLQPKNIMVSCVGGRETEIRSGARGIISKMKGSFLSVLDIIQGDVTTSAVHQALRGIKARPELARFVPWGPSSIHVALARRSKYVAAPHSVTGLMLANHTSIRHLFSHTVAQFDKLFDKGAYLAEFRRSDLFMDKEEELQAEFKDSVEVVKSVIEEYRVAEQPDYLSFKP